MGLNIPHYSDLQMAILRDLDQYAKDNPKHAGATVGALCCNPLIVRSRGRQLSAALQGLRAHELVRFLPSVASRGSWCLTEKGESYVKAVPQRSDDR